MRLSVLAPAALLIGLDGAALAQEAQPSQPAVPAHHDRFDEANTTHDGHLTLAQAQAAGMKMVARNFDAIDADHKGYVTKQDIRVYAQARRAEREARTPPQPGAPNAPASGQAPQ